MTKVIDELIVFFFSVGSDGVQMDLRKLEDGYELSLKSRYDPAESKKVNDLDRFLNQAEKNEGLEEFFWQLAGVSRAGAGQRAAPDRADGRLPQAGDRRRHGGAHAF